MDTLNILKYGGITALLILLLVFEIKDGHIGGRKPTSGGYEYYTAANSSVRIQHVFGSLYKVYVFGNSPAPTKKDRFGTYFTVRARSASEAEYIVDDIYRRGENIS